MRLTEKRNGKNVIPLRNAVCSVDVPYWKISKANDLETFLYGEAADKLARYEDMEQTNKTMDDTWLRFPYAKKPYADSTLRGMAKDELIQIIRDYEHNYAALYEANERGIKAAEKMMKESVEVVRCRDCVYAQLTYDGDCKYCERLIADCDVHEAVYFPGDFYRADGKRKEENDA